MRGVEDSSVAFVPSLFSARHHRCSRTQRGTWPRAFLPVSRNDETDARAVSVSGCPPLARAPRGVGELLAPHGGRVIFRLFRGVRSGARLSHGGVASGVVAANQASATVFRWRVRERRPDGVYHPPPRQENALSRAEPARRTHTRTEPVVREPLLRARRSLRRRGSSTRTARSIRVGGVRLDVDVCIRSRGKRGNERRRLLRPLEKRFETRAPGASARGDPRGGNARGPRGGGG